MNETKLYAKSSIAIISLITLTAFILLSLGLIYYNKEKEEAKNLAYAKLKSIAKLEVTQIENWRRERLADISILANSSILANYATSLFEGQKNLNLRNEILDRFHFESRIDNEYVNIILASINGEAKLAYNPDESEIDSSARNLIKLAANKNQAVFGNIFKNSKNGHTLLDIAAPIKNNDKEVNYVIIYSIDLEKILHPIIESWPGSSQSAETVLLMKSGNYIINLSDNKHELNSSLTDKIPLSKTENPAVQAVLGKRGMLEGIDYKGDRVIGYVKQIENSPWLLISKVNRDELLADVKYKSQTILVVTFLLFIIVAGFALYIFNSSRKRFYKELYEEELELKALKAHFEYVVKFANDIILLEDENFNIIEANEKAVEAYQYSIDELRKLKITDLTNFERKEILESKINDAFEKGGAISEGINKRKDGSTFYAEVSLRTIEIDGKKFHHQIIRDITERKKAEEDLRNSEERFRTTLYSTGDAIVTTDIEGCITHLNRSAEALTGWKEEEAKGKHIKEIFVIYNEDTGALVENPVERILKTGIVVLLSNHTILKSKDGKEVPIGDSGAPIIDSNGKITGVVLVFRDQTNERAAKKAIQESEARLNRAELASKSGNWELHLDTKIMIASEGAKKIYGIYDNYVDYQTIKEIPLTEYRSLLDDSLKTLIEFNHPYNIEYKIKSSDTGEIKDIYSIAEYDNESRILFGVIQDITEQKKLENSRFQLLHIIENSLNEIYIYDSDSFKFEYANQCALTNLEFSFDEILSLSAIDIKPEFSEAAFRKAVEPLISGKDEKLIFDSYHRRKDGSLYPVEIHLQLHQLDNKRVFFSIVNDITDRKNAEIKIQNANRVYAVISQINQAIVRLKNKNELLNEVCKIAVNFGKFKLAWIGIVDEKSDLIKLASSAGTDEGYLDLVKKISVKGSPESEGPSARAVRLGKHFVCNDINNDPIMMPWKEEALKRGFISSIGIPIVHFGKNIGVFNLYASAANFFDKEEIDLLIEVTNDISFALEAIESEIKRKEAEVALIHSDEQLRQSQRVARLGYYSLDISTGMWTNSEMLDEIFGIDSNYKRDVTGWVGLIHPDDQADMANYFSEYVIKEKNEFNKSYRVFNKNDNKSYWVHGQGSVEYDKNGNPVKMFGTIQDITRQKMAEAELRESEERMRITLYSIGDGVITTDEFGNVYQMNSIAEQLTGWKESEAKTRSTDEVFQIRNESTRNIVESPVQKVLREGIIVGLANHTILISKEGKEIPIADSGAPINNENGDIQGVVLVFRDQSKERETQIIIEKSLKEKETLLKEIHHRVKNNFQKIISLISLQSEMIEDEKILRIFEDLQSRLISMSLIHQIMYNSGDFNGVDIKEYIERLTSFLIQTYSTSNLVKLNLEIEEHELDPDSIIPCGLIINEIMSNSLKYAFPVNTEGNIYISFKKIENEYILVVSDDGIGIKGKIDFDSRKSLGLRLIDMLIRQLKGKLEVDQPGRGLRFSIKFNSES